MAFPYYGAKHNLAKYYPAPIGGLVIEPFAGSAAYSVYHAATIDHAILYDADPAVVALWHEYQQMTVADLDLIARQLEQPRVTHPFLGAIGGGSSLRATLDGRSAATTQRMREDWHQYVRARLERSLPYVRTWEIHHGAYSDAPDVEATWYIDPPYQTTSTSQGVAGNAYRVGQRSIDFADLAEWCKARRGRVLVCEQSPAAWLPFVPFRSQGNGAGIGSRARIEVIWTNEWEQPALF